MPPLLKSDGVTVAGLGIYSLESQQLERLPQIGYNPVWLGDVPVQLEMEKAFSE